MTTTSLPPTTTDLVIRCACPTRPALASVGSDGVHSLTRRRRGGLDRRRLDVIPGVGHRLGPCQKCAATPTVRGFDLWEAQASAGEHGWRFVIVSPSGRLTGPTGLVVPSAPSSPDTTWFVRMTGETSLHEMDAWLDAQDNEVTR